MARPREFDRDQVLASAMELFWTQGYQGTSLDDLDQGTGLKRGSLYNAFGDKRHLYLAVLDHYGRSEVAAGVRLLESARPAPKALGLLFYSVAKAVAAGGGRRGCLLCNAAVERAPEDPEVEARVIANYAPLRAAVAQLLRAHFAPRSRADKQRIARLVDGLFGSYLGLYVMAKAGYQPAQLRNAARQALSVLELKP